MNIHFDAYNVEIFGEDLFKENNKEHQLDIIWLLAFPGEGAKIWELCSKKYILAVVSGFDWNADLSPWEAKKAFKQGEDFKGNADDFLDILINKIIPKTEQVIPYKFAGRGIAGYSLAGLFAVYAMYNCGCFTKCASASGSFWYDGFTEYALENTPVPEKCAWYISLGSKEHLTSNKRMSAVKDSTELLVGEWKKNHNVIYEVNDGGHFNQPLERMAKGLDKLSDMKVI